MAEESKSEPSISPKTLPSPSGSSTEGRKKPVCAIVIGMAGSGKTTLMQRLNIHTHQQKQPAYIINLDPAVHKLSYNPHIDIRDTVNYKQVMKQYGLGPNGAIMTSLNLFATRFEQVLSLAEKRADKSNIKNIFVDTPGQIEAFTWSASGTIITDSLGAAFPTVVVYVVDTPRNASPVTFMSNMTYACSIMYKTKLPFLICFNKTDVTSHDFAVEWMNDFDVFAAALRKDESYMSDLSRSMGLVLDEFYRTLRTVGVSAVTGAGMDDFFLALEDAAKEYDAVYKVELDKKIETHKKEKEAKKKDALERLKKDLATSQGHRVVFDHKAAVTGSEEPAPQDDEDE